ncbi:cytosolic Fe-S cluster assembly factor nbp35 [Puccinia graminis f. sp. tritici]|uniref:ATP-binding protein n=2 Tax=Puccinia graminis f. sp. tritici TaxID=56615 RepID=E3JQ80_PUCGT|nr:ATP-binding protein [Puccinia graminis f. sp. tritici CRL 75-36-700-3]EFP74370.2 ATP-binding protein [Puccinia graminis f. sp. tritici CRL 75-36-700-3]KAA1115211.1 cytosolic Fe-S cluster assembly factor nbp35 [Puccinia graminis f. sp. tritici]
MAIENHLTKNNHSAPDPSSSSSIGPSSPLQKKAISASDTTTPTVPENAPEHCPGIESELAGSSTTCNGCENQSICKSFSTNVNSSQQKQDDLNDLKKINERFRNVKHKILVLSGKGGVGKSTFTCGLGWAFSGDGDNTALLDIDITGPSLPMMLGLSPDVHRLHSTSTGWSPLYVSETLSAMSIGFMLPSTDSAVIWRGPKKNGMIKQFLKDVDWCSTEDEEEELGREETAKENGKENREEGIEYMIIDTPPGTTDEHLSIVSYLKQTGITGAIILTTPQEVSIQDVRRIISFCKKTQVKILGLVENMSGFICPNCNGASEIFLPTTGGADRLCRDEGLELLGKIPLDPKIGKGSDLGVDWLNSHPDSLATKAYYDIVDKVKLKIQKSSS